MNVQANPDHKEQPPVNPILKVFEVMIYSKYYDVFDIDGKEHEGYNDIPKTWWLYNSERLPAGLTPPIDSPHWEPFRKSISRRVWSISFKQGNTTKEKWGETQYSNYTGVEMICNGKPVYSFGTTGGDRGLTFGMAKAQHLIVMMEEHPFNFFNPESENGRKIYWKGLPASIRTKSHPGEIGVVPDYTCGLSKEEWWRELLRREKKIPAKKDEDWAAIEEEDLRESMSSDYINWGDALSDGHIDWFRKDNV